MKIHNFRTGFATNSSSSHSVILIPDDMVGKVREIPESSGYGYGWDHFRLVSEEDKLRYLCAQFFTSIRDKKGRQAILDRFAQEHESFAHIELKDKDNGEYDEYDTDLSVDHQSVWSIKPTPEVMDKLIKFFKSPRVVVLGGNDNDDNHPNTVSGADEVTFLKSLATDGAGENSIRVDGDYMIAFDKQKGTKVRFSLETDVPEYVKASAPELVDLKITNYCAGGCEFCYQSSTIKGKHAPLETVKKYVDLLADMGVFEIAIGGGEPTDHPDFEEILLYIHSRGMVPNFTTFFDGWLQNDQLLDTIKKVVGGVGISVHDADGLELVRRAKQALDYRNVQPYRYYGPQIMAQHVVGSVPLVQTGEFIDKAFTDRIAVLLLGYKDIGFGRKFERFDGGEVALFLKMALDSKATAPVSVDTALVDQYPDLLNALGVPRALVTSPEGKFSCYIDAVTGRMGPSSYVEPKTLTVVPETAEDFLKVFATY